MCSEVEAFIKAKYVTKAFKTKASLQGWAHQTDLPVSESALRRLSPLATARPASPASAGDSSGKSSNEPSDLSSGELSTCPY